MTLDEYMALHGTLDDFADVMQELLPLEPRTWRRLIDSTGLNTSQHQSVRIQRNFTHHHLKRNWPHRGIGDQSGRCESEWKITHLSISKDWFDIYTNRLTSLPNWLDPTHWRFLEIGARGGYVMCQPK